MNNPNFNNEYHKIFQQNKKKYHANQGILYGICKNSRFSAYAQNSLFTLHTVKLLAMTEVIKTQSVRPCIKLNGNKMKAHGPRRNCLPSSHS